MNLFDDRSSLINHYLKSGMIGSELGVFVGDFSEKLLGTNPQTLYLVDIFEGIAVSGEDGYEVGRKTADLSESYRNLQDKYRQDSRIRVVKSDSVSFLQSIPNQEFDFVYIDGNHEYEGVKRDIQAAYPKVKIGGYIFGHDYCNMFSGVVKAVDEFCREKNLYIEALSTCRYPTFAIRK